MTDSCKLIQTLLVEGDASETCSCAAISPSSRKLFLAARETTAYIWAAGKAQSLLALKGHVSEVTSVGFHPNETYVGGGAADGSLKIWDLQQGGMVARTLAAEPSVCDAIRTTLFHPLGADMVVTGSSTNFVAVWNYRTRTCLKKLDACLLPKDVAAQYQSEAPQAAATQEMLTARRTALNAARQRSEKRTEALSGPVLQFSPNGRWLLYAPALTSEDVAIASELHTLTGGTAASASMHELMYSYVHVWDMASGEEIATMKHNSSEGSITSYAFHPHELILATSTAAGGLRIWDLEKGFKQITELRCAHSGNAATAGSSLIFSPDGSEMTCLYTVAGVSWMDRFSFATANHSVAYIGTASVGWKKSLLAVSHFQESSLIAIEAGSSPSLWLVNSQCSVTAVRAAAEPVKVDAEPVVQQPTKEEEIVPQEVSEAVPQRGEQDSARSSPQPVVKSEVSAPAVADSKPSTAPATEAKSSPVALPEPTPAAAPSVVQKQPVTRAEVVAKVASAIDQQPQERPVPVAKPADQKIPTGKESRSPEEPDAKPLAPLGTTKRARTRSKKSDAAQKAPAPTKKHTFLYSDRTNAEHHLNLADFLPRGVTIDPYKRKSVAEVSSELFAPTVHKKLCSTLFGRLGVLKGLRKQAQAGEWAGVLDTAARTKEKDTALVANMFEGILGSGLPVIKDKHIVYQPVVSPFQPEQCRDLMQLVQLLVSSKNSENAITGMLMLQRTTLTFSKATLKSSLCYQYFNIVMRQVHKIRKMSSNDDSSSKRRLQSLAKLVSATYRDSTA